jgi:hypothetical protein
MLTRPCLIASFALIAACKFSEPPATDAGELPPPKVSFEFLESGADEISGMLMIPVVLSDPSETPVTVAYVVDGGGTATPGMDFTVQSNSLTFAPGVIAAEIPVAITNDVDETESIERFAITLMTPQGAVIGKTPTHTITIADHILPRVQFMNGTTTGAEGTPSTLTLILDKPAEGASTIVIGVAPGATTPADAGDLTLAEGTVVDIPDGATSVMVPVGEVNDELDEEDNENLILSLKGASPNLFVGVQATETHAIADNDLPPVVQFTAASSTVEENVTQTTLTVSLTAVSGRAITVRYDDDASAGDAESADATVTGSGTNLAFAAGDLSKTITITVANDAIDEDAETVVVDLSAATNAQLTGVSTHTLTINTDLADLPSIAYATASAIRDERDENRDIPVVMTGQTERTVSVGYGLSAAGTASTPFDFTVIGNSLSFGPTTANTTTKNIVIDINEDTIDEGDETVIINLLNPTNATLGTLSSFTFTINNDD